MMMSLDGSRVAVVGATGAVGKVMLEILEERQFPASEVIAVESKRSEGREIPFGRGLLTVRALDESVLKGVDLVLLDTPDEVVRQWAPRAVEAGAVVVDNSAAWRMEADVPLVIPEINPQAIEGHKGIIASPNCTTIGVAVALWPLHQAFSAEQVVVSSYQAVSGAGSAGVEELREQVQKLINEIDSLGSGTQGGTVPDPSVFVAPIAFNVVPMVGSTRQEGFTGEEVKMVQETRKITGLPQLKYFATCVRVPSVVGHGATVYVEFRSEVDVQQALQVLKEAPGVQIEEVPNPLAAAGTDPVYVGRVRRDPSNARALCFFSVMDNLRKGAALNTVQIAELLLSAS